MAEQIVRQTPAEFIEAPAKAYIQELETAVGGLKDLDLSRLYGPQFLAQPGALQTQAEQLASGLGGFQPFLTAAQASTGPQAFQQFMSPYQQDVIDTTLAEFDRQTAAGIPGIAAQKQSSFTSTIITTRFWSSTTISCTKLSTTIRFSSSTTFFIRSTDFSIRCIGFTATTTRTIRISS